MKFGIVLAATSAAFGISAMAGAASLTQSDYNKIFQFEFGDPIVQTFTAVSNNINGLSFQLSAANAGSSNDPFTVSLFSGSNKSGSVLASKTYNLTGLSNSKFDQALRNLNFDATGLTVGEQYSLRLTTTGSSGYLGIGLQESFGEDAYSGGLLSFKGNDRPGGDLAFRVGSLSENVTSLSQINYNKIFQLEFGDPIVQSFTATADNIEELAFQLSAISPRDVNLPLTIGLFSGTTGSGTALATETYNITGLGSSGFDRPLTRLSFNASGLTIGDQYSLRLTTTGNSAYLGIGLQESFGEDAYTGGLLSFKGSDRPGGDLAFQVTGAVPEPAAWAIMVGGFGLVGAAMRRRKVAVSFA